MIENPRLEYLFQRWLEQTCSKDEKRELFSQVIESKNDEKSREMLDKVWLTVIPNYRISEEKATAIFENILSSGSKVVPIQSNRLWYRYVAAAASIVLMLGVGAYFLFFNKTTQPTISQTQNDVEAPKSSKAVITLADGKIISLDSFSTLRQGNVAITKTADGKIIYSGVATEMLYNTLSNPRGSKVIDMQLSDGSHVWLNAGSSVTYPVAFIGAERKVSIKGEAYFEVAHNSAMPFKVSKDEMEVSVLGTHFNVNAYDDESEIKVTLLEGSVRVNNTIIKPGQQAQVNSTIKVSSDVDLQQVMAWKNGLFDFNKTEIGEIMRQMERWYDMQVEYPSGKPKITLSGNISRNINASKVLEMLEMSGVHFTIEGKRIIVKL